MSSSQSSEASVAVIIPVFNGAEFLRNALTSILEQKHAISEIIVIDDGSKDGSSRICREFGERITYRYQENLGPSAARNHGISLSSARFVSFLDADDVWPIDRTTTLLSYFLANSDLSLAVGKTEHFTDNVSGLGNTLPEESHFSVQVGACLFCRSVFATIGGFDESLRFGEDADLLFRIREMGLMIAYSDEVSLFYRRHQANSTNDKKLMQQGLLTACRRSIKRRRGLQRTALAPIGTVPKIKESK